MAQLTLDIQAEMPLEKSAESTLRATVLAVLAHQKITDDTSLTVLLTDDETMRRLNRDYAGLDRPTDVLSFEVGEDDALMAGELAGYLGDIAISLMKAERQAEKGGHSLTAELQLLTVHGVLHLLGYDHDLPEKKAAMWAVQKAILDSLSVQVTIPS